MDTVEQCRAIVAAHQSRKVAGVRVDAQTARVIVLVHDALSEDNRAKFTAMPVERMARVAWKLVK